MLKKSNTHDLEYMEVRFGEYNATTGVNATYLAFYFDQLVDDGKNVVIKEVALKLCYHPSECNQLMQLYLKQHSCNTFYSIHDFEHHKIHFKLKFMYILVCLVMYFFFMYFFYPFVKLLNSIMLCFHSFILSVNGTM